MSESFSNSTPDFTPITSLDVLTLVREVEGVIVETSVLAADHPDIVRAAELLLPLIPGGAAILPIATMAMQVLGFVGKVAEQMQARTATQTQPIP